MSSTSLEQKTIRPGNLVGYSYYYSKRAPDNIEAPTKKQPLIRLKTVAVLALAAIFIFSFYPSFRNFLTPSTSSAQSNSTLPGIANTNPCYGNKEQQYIKVSINARRLWACQDGKLLLTSSVVTGITTHPDTTTPTGTYHIYDKVANTTLTGSDSTGSWSDPVHYWMPFLNNQYGTYGLHDATWRPSNAFGNISPNSNQASHGCVELPLATASWLYTWVTDGATVSITS